MAVLVLGLMRVDSSGSVSRPATGGAMPDVVSAALTVDDDRRRLRAGLDHVAQLLECSPLSEVVHRVTIDERGTGAEQLFGADDDSIDRWMFDHPGPYAHPACTCRLGRPGGSGVVVSGDAGETGRLIGADGVHLADASILPDLVQGGLQAPVAAVANLVADDLLADDLLVGDLLADDPGAGTDDV
jgi:choline dehydrogenase-like flavoprotein